MTPPQAKTKGTQALLTQLWEENPIFRQVLGICSALAVTNLMFNTLLMCLGLIWATTLGFELGEQIVQSLNRRRRSVHHDLPVGKLHRIRSFSPDCSVTMYAYECIYYSAEA